MSNKIKQYKHHIKMREILVALIIYFCLSSIALGAPQPDFTIAPAGILFSKNNPVEGESVVIIAYVINQGAATKPQADIDVRFFEGAPGSDGLEIGKGDIIIELKSGQREKVEAKWRAKAGSKDIYIVIDPDNAIAESDETNNQAFRAITGKALELPKPTQAEIEAAVQKGIKWLRSLQGKELVVYCPDGHENSAFMGICPFCGKSLKGRAVQMKDDEDARGGWNSMIGPGATALVLMTLLHAGVPESDKAVTEGIDYLLNRTPVPDWNQWEESYDLAAAVLALIATGNKEKYLTRVTFAAKRILSMQKHGGWGYGGFPDMAHMHYVLLALYAAQKWEIQIPKEALQQAADWAKSTQREDGGWGYGGADIDSPWAVSSYGSMTTTALIVLKICGIPTTDPQFQKGLEWLKRHYTITSNPGAYDWGYYYLLALQRAMTIPPEQALIGERNWYEEGTAYLLSQQQPDGSWKGSEQEAALMATPFVILFLKKAIPF